LQKIVARVLTYLLDHVDHSLGETCPFRKALDEALAFAQLSPADLASIEYTKGIDEWPSRSTVLKNLSTSYADLLDIRVHGYPEDHLLWDVVDVPTTFGVAAAAPDCEHLCLAILVLEGVVPDIASANWDGLIESAVNELTSSSGTALLVCVRAEDLRGPPLLTRLLKFHGCAVRASTNPAVYRPLLIARKSQITDWPNNPAFAPIQAELITLAGTKRTLMIGLSAQDSNIQHIFSAARNLMPWEWPCVPPAHVFAEDKIGQAQLNILKVVYGHAFGPNGAAIAGGALLRAYAKPALIALVLNVISRKLQAFARTIDAPHLGGNDRIAIERGILHLRDRLADNADVKRLEFLRMLIVGSAKGIALFQTGAPASATRAYRPVGTIPIHLIPEDVNLSTNGIREMAAALGLLGLGDDELKWVIDSSDPASPSAGALRVDTIVGRQTRIFFAAHEWAGIQLEVNGLVTSHDSDALVIHSTKPIPMMARSPRTAPGRTGKLGLRQIGMRDLLRDARDIHDLRVRFSEECAL
jgi:hypothetical protein